MSDATTISLVVGAWGALVATTLAVREVLQDHRTVRVGCETRWGYDQGGREELFIRVRISNYGRRPVEPRHVFFESRDGRILPLPHAFSRGPTQPDGQRQLPRRLGDGETVVVEFEAQALEHARATARAAIEFVVVEASGKKYKVQYPR
jgi:hypothetical protein